MKSRLPLAFVAIVLFVGCGSLRVFRWTPRSMSEHYVQILGTVCDVARPIYDSDGTYWGERLVIAESNHAALAQTCETAGRIIKVPAAKTSELEAAKSLESGQRVVVRGELAPDARCGIEGAACSPSHLEILVAEDIDPKR